MTLQFACQPFAVKSALYAANCGCALVSPTDDALADFVLDEASDMIAILSGMRVHGICTKTVRPVTDRYCQIDPWRSPGGYNWGYQWGIYSYGSGPWWLQGTVPLRGPNTDVVAVHIDGQQLPLASYGLIENRYLMRKDGANWPTTNDLTLPDTQVGTWSITYRFGRAPDWLTQQATLELACELAAEYKGGDSHLPPGVTSANIQGANVSLQDRADALRASNGEGIPMLSRFLGIYAPDGQNRSTVWSPELILGYDLIEDEGPSGS